VEITDCVEAIVEEAFVIEMLLKRSVSPCRQQDWWDSETPFLISNIDFVLVCSTADLSVWEKNIDCRCSRTAC
jgi:hypothetical protein